MDIGEPERIIISEPEPATAPPVPVKEPVKVPTP